MSNTTLAPEERRSLINDFIAQVNDPSVSFIRAPAGTFDVSEFGGFGAINIGRSNLTIDFSDFTLTMFSATRYLGVYVYSQVQHGEIHGIGAITPEMDYIDVSPEEDISQFAIGELHYLKLGVNITDPNEAQWTLFRRITSIDGRRIYYDRPFGLSTTIYPSYEELSRISGYPEKVGPWGPNNVYGSQQLRGLGADHGIRRIIKESSNIELNNLKIVYNETSRKYGAWGLSFNFSDNCRANNIEVVNPCGSAIHLNWCQNVTLTNVKITGVGDSEPYGVGSKKFAASAISGWGPRYCTVNDLHITADNTCFANFEAGWSDLTFNNVYVETKQNGSHAIGPQLGFYGLGKALINKIEFNIGVSSSSIFPSWLNSNIVIKDISVPEKMPDFFSWVGRGTYKGYFKWGNRRFGEPKWVTQVYTSKPQNTKIPFPEGMIIHTKWKINSRDGLRSINIQGGDVFAQNPDKLEFENKSNNNQINLGRTYEEYRAAMSTLLSYSTVEHEITMSNLVREEIIMPDTMFSWELLFHTPPNDVVSQILEVKVNGMPIINDVIGRNVQSYNFEAGSVDSVLELSLRYEDAAGNVSEAHVESFTIVDQTPPDKPVGFAGIIQVGQVQ